MTLAPIHPVFQAEWTKHNIHLQPKTVTLSQKVARAVWNLFSIVVFPIGVARAIGWAVHFVAKKMALPSAIGCLFWGTDKAIETFQTFCQQIKPHYELERRQIRTPDGVLLSAAHFRNTKAARDAPTIILCPSNNSFIEQNIQGWLIQEAVTRNAGCHFVIFDYRGVNNSEGEANCAKDLILDGDSVYQFVHKQLEVSPTNIRWFGWSLGGAVASNTKALHPECTAPLCNVRSFTSSKEVAKRRFSAPYLFWFPWAIEKQRWNLRVPFAKLKGPLMVVYHKQDVITPFDASAYKGAKAAKATFTPLELFQTREQAETSKGLQQPRNKPIDHHSEPLSRYSAQPGIRADQAIADFILAGT